MCAPHAPIVRVRAGRAAARLQPRHPPPRTVEKPRRTPSLPTQYRTQPPVGAGRTGRPGLVGARRTRPGRTRAAGSLPRLVVGLDVAHRLEHRAVALEAGAEAQHPDAVALLGADLRACARALAHLPATGALMYTLLRNMSTRTVIWPAQPLGSKRLECCRAALLARACPAAVGTQLAWKQASPSTPSTSTAPRRPLLAGRGAAPSTCAL